MLELWAARNSEAMAALSYAVKREGSILRSLLVRELATSTRSAVEVSERWRHRGGNVLRTPLNLFHLFNSFRAS